MLAVPTVAELGATRSRVGSDDVSVTTVPPAGEAAPRKRMPSRESPAATVDARLTLVVGGGFTVMRTLSTSKLGDETTR